MSTTLALSADELSELLAPAVQALLDTAPRQGGRVDDPPRAGQAL